VKDVWLLRDGDVLASAEVAQTLLDRTRGLLGRDRCDGAMLLLRTRSVHSAGMRFALDVAFLDGEMVVLGTTRLGRWSVALPRRGTRHVLEAQAGSFERWHLVKGDKLEIREPS
jgi:uncharacterized membrane protein (UPF0127 family)